MTDNSCIEQEALVEYLYGEADDQTRQRIETHARSCAQCADEIGELREVRGTLETWSPPPVPLGFRVVADTDDDETGRDEQNGATQPGKPDPCRLPAASNHPTLPPSSRRRSAHSLLAWDRDGDGGNPARVA